MANSNQRPGLRLGFIGMGADATAGWGEWLASPWRVTEAKGKARETSTRRLAPLCSLLIAVLQQLSRC